MQIRTTVSGVAFKHPFYLSSLDGPQPAGIYRLVVEEEELPGLSFLAYRRTAVSLHIPAIANSQNASQMQVIAVDFDELQSALEADDRRQHKQPTSEGI